MRTVIGHSIGVVAVHVALRAPLVGAVSCLTSLLWIAIDSRQRAAILLGMGLAGSSLLPYTWLCGLRPLATRLSV